MHKPLLALTRLPRPAKERLNNQRSHGGATVENMRQLIQLRWIAVAGQTLTILLAYYALSVPLALLPMLGLTVFLAAANLLATMALARDVVLNGEIMLALLLDMTALTLQLYFSGGATNPFVSLYLLQVVLGAILLPPLWAACLGVAAALCYALLSVRYVPLLLPGTMFGPPTDVLAAGRWTAFVMVAALLVFFIARISRNLRARNAHLADMRHHAAQEEGIVRMGLFASGAAHELGTPLGTLAVILADWRRVPAIARDPELLAEVEEMQAELRRCKAIVSDILHSAGQPRGEPMESAAAAPFLEAVVEAWTEAHAGTEIDVQADDLGTSVIAVNPALRQAIGSLLDNAVEASSGPVTLHASVAEGMVAIAVRDHGPGFAPAALANLGKPYQSTKGAGHGLGLFLASNVARRLGGKLEATNRSEGGAEVRLILPLANPAMEV